jgi:hypothetical protein
MARRKSVRGGALALDPERKLQMTEAWLRDRLIAMRDDYRRKRAIVDGAIVCEEALALFDQYLVACRQAVATLEEAGLISGYNPEHLSRLVRQGKIPDLRPAGSRGRIRIALTDLPIKPGHKRADAGRVTDIAAKLYGKKG